MRLTIAFALTLLALGTTAPARAAPADACKQCRDQQKSCMSNYAGPTCKTEYDRCMKSCKARK